MNSESAAKKLLVVGAGGIGASLLENLIPAIQRVALSCSITVMDADTVEPTNLGHQRYSLEDVGHHKVTQLAQRFQNDHSSVIGLPENLRRLEQLEGYDLVIVCVDRPEPRRLVHGLDIPWIDLRCSGDGWVALTSKSPERLIQEMTPDHEPKSCQVDGALESGNLEFGFAVAAAIGSQWAMQELRGRPSPTQTMGSITYGALSFPEVKA
ncbi:MAG TPA: ThiF family adenylyltransferase [Poseidonia sp.]|nr:ThiF family adenylyltransferase [Poseidonia sp.]